MTRMTAELRVHSRTFPRRLVASEPSHQATQFCKAQDMTEKSGEGSRRLEPMHIPGTRPWQQEELVRGTPNLLAQRVGTPQNC